MNSFDANVTIEGRTADALELGRDRIALHCHLSLQIAEKQGVFQELVH
jgi:hypothetical protein